MSEITLEERAEESVAEALRANKVARESLVALLSAWGYAVRAYAGYVSAERDGSERIALRLGETLELVGATHAQAQAVSAAGASHSRLQGGDLATVLRAALRAGEYRDLDEARAALIAAQAEVARLEAQAGGAS